MDDAGIREGAHVSEHCSLFLPPNRIEIIYASLLCPT